MRPNPDTYQVMNKDERDRFLSCVDVVHGHHLWIGPIGNGYGRFFFRKKMVYAHVLAWVYENGRIPEGKELGHTCEYRNCVLHVRPVTHLENIHEGNTGMHMKIKTHCPLGHPYEGKNIVWTQGRNGLMHRKCRTCRNAQKRMSGTTSTESSKRSHKKKSSMPL